MTPTLRRTSRPFGENNARHIDRSRRPAGQGRRCACRDRRCRGARPVLDLQPTDVKSWAVRYRVGHRTCKLTLPGRYPVLSLSKARDAARMVLENVADGDDPAAAKRAGTRADDTLAAYVALYREKHVSTVRPVQRPISTVNSSTCRTRGRDDRFVRFRRRMWSQ